MLSDDPSALAEQRQGDGVRHEADQRERQHRAGLHRGRIDEAADAFDEQVGTHREKHDRVGQRRKDLRTVQPKVRRADAGRAAMTEAASASSTAPASVAMWPASASSASEPLHQAPTSSTTRTVSVTARTSRSLDRSSARPAACPCPCPMRRA